MKRCKNREKTEIPSHSFENEAHTHSKMNRLKKPVTKARERKRDNTMKIRNTKTSLFPVANAEQDEQRSAMLKVAARIQAQRVELKAQSAAIREQIEWMDAHDRQGISSFDVGEVLNDSDSLAALVKQKERLDAALLLPNYADAEFRKLSIPYLQAVAKEKTEKAEKTTKRIEEIHSEIKALESEAEKCSDELNTIKCEWFNCLSEIGITDGKLLTFGVNNYEIFAREYMELCAKYEKPGKQE